MRSPADIDAVDRRPNRPFAVPGALARSSMRAFAIAAMLAAATASHALTLGEAGENLFYFEHARLSAEACEREGVPTRSAHAAWLKENEEVLHRSTDTIRTLAAARGIGPADQDMLVAQALSLQAARARDHVAARGVPCARFDRMLEGYSSFLKK